MESQWHDALPTHQVKMGRLIAEDVFGDWDSLNEETQVRCWRAGMAIADYLRGAGLMVPAREVFEKSASELRRTLIRRAS